MGYEIAIDNRVRLSSGCASLMHSLVHGSTAIPIEEGEGMEKTLVSRIVGLDYRITRTPSTVTIEVLDYHAQPLTLTGEQLREFGLQLVEQPGPRVRKSEY